MAETPAGCGSAAQVPHAPADLATSCFRDDAWLAAYPLTAASALDYFARSPFWQPPDGGPLSTAASLASSAGTPVHGSAGAAPPTPHHQQNHHQQQHHHHHHYVLHEAQPPHLFVIRKLARAARARVAARQCF